MADLDLTVVQTAVADAMGGGTTSDDPAVVSAVAAAEVYVLSQTGRDNPLVALPDDALTVRGMTGLSVRILRDTDAANGEASIGANYDTLYTPEDLYRHWRHYFRHLELGAGIA